MAASDLQNTRISRGLSRAKSFKKKIYFKIKLTWRKKKIPALERLDLSRFSCCQTGRNGGHDGCVQRGLGFGLTLQSAQTEFMSKPLDKFFFPPLRTSSLACLLFTAEVNAIPPEQTVQLRGKK